MHPKMRSRSAATDIRDRPAYTVADAARYLRLPATTLRAWTSGRTYKRRDGQHKSAPLIQVPDRRNGLLSFSNLVEAHVLRALRVTHGVSAPDVRKALHYAERELGMKHLLLSQLLRVGGKELLLDRYGELISLSQPGQLVMRRVVEAYLSRIEWDENNLPVRLYPMVEAPVPMKSQIAIDPRIAFGRPMIARRAISTAAIVSRLAAGESAADLAEDYDLREEEVLDAATYEMAA